MEYSLDELYPALNKLVQEEETAVPIEKSEPTAEHNILGSMADTILGVVRTVATERVPEKREAARNLLGNLLLAREQYYFAIAQAINPNIIAVDKTTALYRLANTELYGSLPAILDADSSIDSHRVIAEALSIHTNEEEIETLFGESLQPRSLDSQITIAGSHAQERVQRYGNDIDFVEYITLTAHTQEDAASLFSEVLKKQMKLSYEIEVDGKRYTLYPNYVSVSGAKHHGENINNHKWKPQEIMQGFKEFKSQNGDMEILTLEEVCSDPSNLYFEYTCFSDDDAFHVSKITMIQTQNPEGTVLSNSSVRSFSPFQEIYFESPERFDLTGQTLDPDEFVTYLINMASEVRYQENNIPPNQLKKMKRLYNFCKVQGDFAAVEAIESIFSNPICQIYQLANHIEVALDVQRRIGDTRPVEQLKTSLSKLIETVDHPQAIDILTYLDQGNEKKLRSAVKNIVNDTINQEISKNELLQKKVTEVLRLKGGMHGANNR